MTSDVLKGSAAKEKDFQVAIDRSMIIDLVFFPLFTLSVCLIGLGLWNLMCKVTCIPPGGLPIFITPLLGAFTLGLVAMLVNFVSGVAVSFSYSLLLAILIYGLVSAGKEDIRGLFILCLLAALCTPLAADMQPGPDAALYHLPHQKWIRDHAIVFGLANLHGRYGFSSYLEYINSLLWIGEVFKLLSYMTAIFFVAFLSYLYYAINSRHTITRMFALLMAVNVLVFDGYFVWRYGYADSAAGIAFALSVAVGILLLEDRDQSPGQKNGLLLVFLIVSTMSVALKVSSVLVAVWALYVLFTSAIRDKVSLRRVVSITVLPTIFSLLWTLRGVIVSGCVLFPASWSCLDVPWSAEQEALTQAQWITAWARHPHSGLYSLEGWTWIANYWLEASTPLLVWLALSAIAVICVAIVYRRNLPTVRMSSLDSLVLVAVAMAALSLWFLRAPSDRFGIGVFMIAAPAFTLAALGAPKFDPELRTLILSIALIVLLADNQGGFSLKGLSRFLPLNVPAVDTVPDSNFGTRPESGDGDCWTATHCAPYDRPTPTTKSDYLFFEMPSD
ncbi:hypothetical protein FMN50_00540 [Rhodobacterales bacterium]|nr:hypothetical protein FMN50_00540 [Rhodobacterales bacterium]